MVRRYRLIIYFLFTIAALAGTGTVCLAQVPGDITESGTPFGEIPDSLFRMETYQPDPSAPFVYALKELDISFQEDERSIVALLDYHVRVKVFDSSARQAALVAIPYYFENQIEEVVNLRAVTYTPSGQRIPLEEDAIRTINVNSRYNVIEFTMPAVEDGAVLEYSYRIRRRYIEELPDFFLAHKVPTSLARISITCPPYLRYSAVPENFEGTLHHEEVRIDTSSVAKIFTVPQPEPLLKETWTARRVPAVEEEAYISSLDDYRGKLKFQLSEFGVPRQKLENSWEFVVAQLRRNQNILGRIQNYTHARELGQSIRGKVNSPEEAQDSIFRYLQAHANFNGSRSPYSELGDKPVLDGQPADQAAINQTLIAMLRGAGIEAWPVLISTREFGQINRSFPSFFQFNGQLAWSRIGGETYFMDAGFPHSQPNLIPVDTYNETGLLLQPESFSWMEIAPPKSVFAIDITVDARLDAQGTVSGEISTASSGYPAQVIRRQVSAGEPPASILSQVVFDGYTNATFTGVELSGVASYEQPVTMNAGFTLEDYATSFSDGLRFRPMIVGYLMSNPFNETDRELPVTLDAPEQLSLTYRIQIPEGFTLEGGAENRSIGLRGARLTESYKVEGDILNYEFHIDITRKQFEPEQYPQLLDLYKRWVQISNGTWLIERE